MAKLKETSHRRSVILIVLAAVSIVLLKHSLMKKPVGLSYRKSSHPRVARHLHSSELGSLAGRNYTGELDALHIDGYWKEVRESFGLPPLPDTVLFPCEPISSLGDTLDATDPTFARDGSHLRRLGRLNPTLHREYSTSRSRSKSTSLLCNGPQFASEDPARGPNDYPYLFIARESHRAPRTPVSALAASFRAIAARELKAHRGKTHPRHGNPLV